MMAVDLLLNSCWSCIKIDDNELIVKILIDDQCLDPFYVVLFSDFTNIWKEELHSQDVIKRNNSLNPNIEAPVACLLQQINKVGKSSTLSLKIRNEHELVIASNSFLSTLLYKWEFHARQCGKQLLADHLTFPLIGALAELNRRQQHLIKIIGEKDTLIEQIKADGHTFTCGKADVPFDVAAFDHEMVQSSERADTFSAATVALGLEHLFRAVNMRLKIKEEVAVAETLLVPTDPEEQPPSDPVICEHEKRKELAEKLADEKTKKAKGAKKLRL